MSKFTPTLAAFAVIVLLGMTLSSAQRAKPEKGELEKDPDGTKVTLRGTVEDIPLSELIQIYAEFNKQTIMYDPKKMSGTVTVVTSSEGFVADTEETLLAALAQFRLTLVKVGDYSEIIPAAEAVAVAEVVTEAELQKLPAHKFARIVVHLKHTDPNVARAALQNLTSRQGGVVNPVISAPGNGRVNALIICDTAANLREILEVIVALDNGPGKASRVVALKNAKAADILSAILSSAGIEVEVGVVEATGQIVLTGRDTDLDRVAGVVAALDVKSEK